MMRRHLTPGEHLRAGEVALCKLLVDGVVLPLAFHAHRYECSDRVVVESHKPDDGGHSHVCETCQQVLVKTKTYPARVVEVEFDD